jgi:hypothetical protein
MSEASFLSFLMAARDDRAVLVRYDQRNQAQLLFHARNEGYDFTAEEMAAVVGALEASVILTKDRSPYDGTAPLWRHMWGRRHLAYLVEHVLSRHSDAELGDIVAGIGAQPS